MKYIILSFFIFFAGCTFLAKKEIILDKRTYFNSELAARNLFMVYANYVKYQHYYNPRKNIKVKYFVYKDGSFEDAEKIEITKEKADMLRKTNQFFLTFLYKNGTIIGIVNNSISYYYNYDNSLANIEFNKMNNIYNYDYSHTVSCFKYRKLCTNVVRNIGDTSATIGLETEWRTAKIADIFKGYYKKYNGEKVFYDKQNRIKKVIYYQSKAIEYFFYDKVKQYIVTCTYFNKTCKIFYEELST